MASRLPLDEPTSLDLLQIGQEKEFWCWAAVSEMVLDYFYRHESFRQCDIVIARLKSLGSKEERCTDIRGWPHFSGRLHFETTTSPLRWDDLLAEFKAKRPVVFSWCWGGSPACADPDNDSETGHVVVAAGCTDNLDNRGTRYLLTLDPRPCHLGDVGYYSYDEYRGYTEWGRSATHNHWQTYFGLRRPEDRDHRDGPIAPEAETGPRLTFSRPTLPDLVRDFTDQVIPSVDRLRELHILRDSEAIDEDTLSPGAPLHLMKLSPDSLPESEDLDAAEFFGLALDRAEDEQTYLFPLSSDGQVRSMIIVRQSLERRSDRFRVAGFGFPNRARRLFGAMDRLRSEMLEQGETESDAAWLDLWIPGVEYHLVLPVVAATRKPKRLPFKVAMGVCDTDHHLAVSDFALPLLREAVTKLRAEGSFGPS